MARKLKGKTYKKTLDLVKAVEQGPLGLDLFRERLTQLWRISEIGTLTS